MHAELQCHEHVLFHRQDFLFRVRVVCNIHKVGNDGRVDLFVLGSYEHSGDTDQLQFVAVDRGRAQESVDQIHSKEESLLEQSKLQVHLNEPIDEDLTHRLIDVLLVVHVFSVRHRQLFICQTMMIDVANELSYTLGVKVGIAVL